MLPFGRQWCTQVKCFGEDFSRRTLALRGTRGTWRRGAPLSLPAAFPWYELRGIAFKAFDIPSQSPAPS